MIQLNIVTTSEKKARQRDSKKAKKEAMEDNVEVKKTGDYGGHQQCGKG